MDKREYRILASGDKADLLRGKYKISWAYLCSADGYCINQNRVSSEEGLILCLANNSPVVIMPCKPQSLKEIKN